MVGKKQESCWGVLWVPKGHEWACWTGRKPTTWHLMPLDKHLGKQGCNCQFRSHKLFNSQKVGQSTFALQLRSCSNVFSSASLFVASLSFVIYLSLFVILPVVLYLQSSILLSYFKFVSVYVSVCYVSSDYLLFNYLALFLPWFWKCVPGISIPITTTIRQVNKYQTTRLRHINNFSDWVKKGRDMKCLEHISSIMIMRNNTINWHKRFKMN